MHGACECMVSTNVRALEVFGFEVVFLNPSQLILAYYLAGELAYKAKSSLVYAYVYYTTKLGLGGILMITALQ